MRLTLLCAAAAISLAMAACGQARPDAAAPNSSSAAPTASAGAPAGKPAATSARGAPGTPGVAGSDLPKSVNTRDPVDGLPVDPTIPPVVVDVTVVSPQFTVVIGVSCADNAKRIKADPDLYAGAAQHNAVARRATDTLLPK